MTPSTYSLGIDIGGTFTDVVLYNHEQAYVFSHKELTTPDEPTFGAVRGVQTLLEREQVSASAITRVVHATTLFANALLERQGAPTGLVTTEGFADTLEMRREHKYDLYDLFIEIPKPLIPRALRAEVKERVRADGTIELPLDGDGLLHACRQLVDQGVQSVAVVFLHAYANPQNELEARRLLERHLPELYISISSDVSPQFREFERTSTTAANAYIGPLADRYLESLEQMLRGLGINCPLLMMLSNGGLTHLGEARRVPIQLLESGPAAGAIAAGYFSKRSQIADVLAFDMGGTTAKLSIVEGHQPLVVHQFEAARERRFASGSGIPLHISTVELIEVGAGGGSIAHLDSLNLLKVGPLSANSKPGPACYLLGGTDPTVTDANLLMGHLDPDTFAGGTMKLSSDAASESIGNIVDTLGMSKEHVVDGVLAIVNENMAAAARVHVAEQGYDASDFALIVTGGGGPLHGCDVARRLGITRVICPPGAGVASALGLLIAPARVDRSATIARQLKEIGPDDLEAAFQTLEEEASSVMRDTLTPGAEYAFERRADIRFVGQGFEIITRLPDGPFDETIRERIHTEFQLAYTRVFGQVPPVEEIELVNLRLAAVEQLVDRPLTLDGSRKETWRVGVDAREVWNGETGRSGTLKVLSRESLVVDEIWPGPLIIEDASSTLLVPEEASVLRDRAGNLIIDLKSDSRSGSATTLGP